MKTEKSEVEPLIQETDPFLNALKQEIRDGRQPRTKQTSVTPPHPTWETLVEYAACRLPEHDAGRIRKHLVHCMVCARKALRAVGTTPSHAVDVSNWEEWVKGVVSFPSEAVRWVSELWQPRWAGVAVSAADIPKQNQTFTLKDGQIDISCLWRPQEGNYSAYIEVSWIANLSAERELLALFFDPETRQMLAEIPLGTYLQGGKSISTETLGFDPSNTPWGMSILLKERKS